jgi:NAD(P)-dependent dehydrogenase (short-subunit alcohol dehydrogenase family)
MPSISPYAALHTAPQGPGDARPTALQIIQNEHLLGALPHLTVLITGATGGLGLETARAIYATGARVYITARSASKGEDAIKAIAGSNTDNRLEYIIMDLTSRESVQRAAETFLAKSERLNILINSAARVVPASHRKDREGIEVQFSANHLGHFLLFSLLKSTLLASSTPEFHSRVVIVASVGHRYCKIVHLEDLSLDTTPGKESTMYGYAHAKLANLYFANGVERRFGGMGLHAFSLQPGGVVGTLLGEAFDDESIHAAYFGVEEAANRVKSPEQGAATSVWAAVGKALEGKGGLYLENLGVAEGVKAPEEEWGNWWVPGYAPWAYDEEEEDALWEKSCRLIGVEDS